MSVCLSVWHKLKFSVKHSTFIFLNQIVKMFSALSQLKTEPKILCLVTCSSSTLSIIHLALMTSLKIMGLRLAGEARPRHIWQLAK